MTAFGRDLDPAVVLDQSHHLTYLQVACPTLEPIAAYVTGAAGLVKTPPSGAATPRYDIADAMTRGCAPLALSAPGMALDPAFEQAAIPEQLPVCESTR